MAVHSTTPTAPQTRHETPPRSTGSHKESAVISRAQLRRQRGKVERYTAWVVLFVSFIASVVAFNGGWSNVLALKFGIAATLLAVGLQILLTYLEWHYYDKPIISWGARLVDTATTALGFGPLALPALTAYLSSRAIPAEVIVSWLIIGIASLGVAWYPESRLVD